MSNLTNRIRTSFTSPTIGTYNHNSDHTKMQTDTDYFVELEETKYDPATGTYVRKSEQELARDRQAGSRDSGSSEDIHGSQAKHGRHMSAQEKAFELERERERQLAIQREYDLQTQTKAPHSPTVEVQAAPISPYHFQFADQKSPISPYSMDSLKQEPNHANYLSYPDLSVDPYAQMPGMVIGGGPGKPDDENDEFSEYLALMVLFREQDWTRTLRKIDVSSRGPNTSERR